MCAWASVAVPTLTTRLGVVAALGLGLALAASPAPAEPGGFGLGRAATPEEIAGWDVDVRPDGTGLPPGEGSVQEGEAIYLERCAACHGEFGEGAGRYPVLMGGFDSLEEDRPEKTIGSYWPYASTVWDYVQRAMPFGEARSLSDDETYAVTAFLLYLNEVVEDDFVLTRDNFTEVRLPNRDGFFMRDGPDLPSGEPCMKDCKAAVEVIGRARTLDVTPEDEQQALE